MQRISVIIPCYNEEMVIPDTIKALETFFYKHRDLFDYELIFVDDGSRDATLVRLKFYKQHNRRIKIVSYKENYGKGFAVRQGLLMAKMPVWVVLDADLSVRPDSILQIPNILGNRPILIYGIRYQVVKQPLFRIVAGKIFEWIVAVMFWQKPLDSQCPLKVFINIDKDFINRLTIDGFAYDVELLQKAKKEGIQVSHIIVEYYNKRQSSVTLKKTLRMASDLLRIRFSQ